MTFRSLGFFASSGGVAAAPGMVLMKPTSIAHSGTSATLGANGQVTFTAVTSLSLNGVFSATYDNYVVVVRCNASTGLNTDMRLRASGSDASGSNYVNQALNVDGTSVSAARATTTQFSNFINAYGTQRAGYSAYLYGPFLAQPTAYRSVSAADYLSAYISETAGTHSLSTSYDGFTMFPGSGNITGAVQVYGVRS